MLHIDCKNVSEGLFRFDYLQQICCTNGEKSLFHSTVNAGEDLEMLFHSPLEVLQTNSILHWT